MEGGRHWGDIGVTLDTKEYEGLRLTLLEGGRGRFLGARRHEAPLRSSPLAHLHQHPTKHSHPTPDAMPPSQFLQAHALLSSFLSWLLLTSSTLSGLARWVVVGTACPPPAITALVTCAGAETTAARGLEDRGLEGPRTDAAAATRGRSRPQR